MKRYKTSWSAQKMKINFNQKQWRQDLAAFVKEKKFWGETNVTRSKIIDKKEGIKEFNIYSGYGLDVIIKYKENNEIINCSNEELINQYLIERNMN